MGAVDAISAASRSHTYIGVDEHGKAVQFTSPGNDYGHLILRGGKDGPNYDAQSVLSAAHAMDKAKLRPQIVIDASHANSNKDHKRQLPVLQDIATQIADGCNTIKGVMIESNLVEGAQKLSPGETNITKLVYGQSVTDKCIGWEDTEIALQTLACAVA